MGIDNSNCAQTDATHTAWIKRGSRMIATLLISATLLVSAAGHLSNPFYFLAAIYEYRIVPASAGVALAVALPFIQIVLALALFDRFWASSSFLACAVLFAVFFGAQLSVVLRSMIIECGCFGPWSRQVDIGSLTAVALLCVSASVGAWTARLNGAQSDRVLRATLE